MGDNKAGWNKEELQAPVEEAFAITPHATNPIQETTRGLWVGGAGNITCRMKAGGSDVTFSNVPAGTLLPIRVTHVRATSTATSMLGLV